MRTEPTGIDTMDFNDLHKEQGAEAVSERLKAAQPINDNPEEVKKLISHSIHSFLSLDIPPREDLLSPILQRQSLSMVFAQRGIGKTHFGLGLAYAVSCGGHFMKWQAPKAWPVLYLDGEMTAISMQERLASIVKQNDLEPLEENFQLITPDMQEFGMPDISTLEGQKQLQKYVDLAELIVVDNISTLARTGKENEAEGWLPMQRWALEQRRKGKSVLFIHHAGKGGQQRGTSRREDVLDLVIQLKRPDDYSPEQDARFEIHFDKARNLTGLDAKPFEAQLGTNGWAFRDIEDVEMMKVIELRNDGYNMRDIAQETGISKSKVQRMVKKYDAEI